MTGSCRILYKSPDPLLELEQLCIVMPALEVLIVAPEASVGIAPHPNFSLCPILLLLSFISAGPKITP